MRSPARRRRGEAPEVAEPGEAEVEVRPAVEETAEVRPEAEVAEPGEAAQAEPPKRKRGRPRKRPVEETGAEQPPKRKRGRPRKRPVEETAEVRPEVEVAEPGEAEVEVRPAVEETAEVRPEAEVAEPGEAAQAEPPKRKRGRPRKRPVEETGAEQPPKKKRGRPRKRPVEDTNTLAPAEPPNRGHTRKRRKNVFEERKKSMNSTLTDMDNKSLGYIDAKDLYEKISADPSPA